MSVRPALVKVIGATWLLAASVCTAAPFAYITNQGSHDVSVIDLATDKVVATVPVGRAPAGVATAGAIGRVFVANAEDVVISVIDMRTQRVVGSLPASKGIVGIAASSDGSRLFAADWYGQRLLIHDTARPGSPPVSVAAGRIPAGIALTPDANTAYVAERDDDSVAVIDVATARVTSRIAVGQHPFALLFDAPRQRLYALNVMSDDVSVIDARKQRVIATVKVGKAPYGAALTSDGALLYVTNQHAGTVSMIDTATLQPRRTLTGFGHPEGIAAAGDRVYVVNWMDDRVSVLDAASGRLVTQIDTGSNSRGFGAFIGAPAAP